MQKLFLNIINLLFLVIFFSCSEDNNPIVTKDENFVYPLEFGNKWEYSRELSVFNFRPDTADATSQDTSTISSISTVEIVRSDTLLNSLIMYVFLENLTEGENFSTDSESYYNNQEDGLYFYAYRGPGYVLPKSSDKKRIYFKGSYFSDIREITSFIEKAIPNRYGRSDSLIYEIPPLKSLPYPLEIGTQWVYREAENPFRIDKKVVRQDSVIVPAGDFNCYKIQWQIDFDNDGVENPDIEFFDYISSEGLIRRHILFKDLIWRSEGGYPIGKFDAEDDSQLIRFHLK